MDCKLICALVLLCCILNVSCVFAQMNDTNVSSTEIGETFSINTTLTPDVPDLAGNDTFYVNSNNVNTYFPDNTLDDKYKNKTLVFSGEFTDIGVLKIKSDFVTIKAPGAHLKNTVFDISGNNVTLMDITMDLDTSYEEVDGAAIYVGADTANVTINSGTFKSYNNAVDVEKGNVVINGGSFVSTNSYALRALAGVRPSGTCHV